MSAATRESTFLRLSGFIRSVRHDPVFRRALRHDPDAVLGPRGLPTGRGASLAVLPPPDAHLEPGLLFGHGDLEADLSIPLELRLVLYGAKPLALIHGPEAEMEALLRAMEARGMTALLSAEEWQPVPDPALAGYSNLVDETRWARPGSGAWRSLLVGPDAAAVSLAWLARTFHWDEVLGRLLGYPACCAEAFEHRWPEAVAKLGGDVAPLSASASGGGPHAWELNVFGRYFGHELIQHFPCHLDCAESIVLASERSAALASFEPDTLADARRVMSAPYLVADGEPGSGPGSFTHEGVVALLGGQAIRREQGWILRFDPGHSLATAPDGSLAGWVRRGLGTFEVDARGRIISADPARPPARLLLFAADPSGPPS